MKIGKKPVAPHFLLHSWSLYQPGAKVILHVESICRFVLQRSTTTTLLSQNKKRWKNPPLFILYVPAFLFTVCVPAIYED